MTDKEILTEIFNKAGLDVSNSGCDLLVDDFKITFLSSGGVQEIEIIHDEVRENLADQLEDLAEEIRGG